ncbi:MAG: hypothetical protein Devi2KO_40680 [Devosia indica]
MLVGDLRSGGQISKVRGSLVTVYKGRGGIRSLDLSVTRIVTVALANQWATVVTEVKSVM